MSLRETIDFAQTHFGNNQGVPDLPNVRPRLPVWLEGRIDEAVRIEDNDQPAIEGTVSEEATPSEATDGTSVEDLFAYYLPFHFYKTRWGTYIRAYGIERLAHLLTNPAPITPSSVFFAFRLLLEHERLHFLAELAASRIEVAVGLPSYQPYFGDRSAALHEEAIANAYALSSGKRGVSAPLVQAAHFWMSKQGAGYRDFHQWIGRRLAIGKRKTAEFMLNKRAQLRPGRAHESRGRSLPPTGPAEFLFQAPSRPNPPTYLIVDAPVPWLRVVRPFPKFLGLQVLVHTNDHKPPHIHIHVLQHKRETRYKWPDLHPLPGDLALSRSDEKSLRVYVQRYEKEIDAKVKGVPWT